MAQDGKKKPETAAGTSSKTSKAGTSKAVTSKTVSAKASTAAKTTKTTKATKAKTTKTTKATKTTKTTKTAAAAKASTATKTAKTAKTAKTTTSPKATKAAKAAPRKAEPAPKAAALTPTQLRFRRALWVLGWVLTLVGGLTILLSLIAYGAGVYISNPVTALTMAVEQIWFLVHSFSLDLFQVLIERKLFFWLPNPTDPWFNVVRPILFQSPITLFAVGGVSLGFGWGLRRILR